MNGRLDLAGWVVSLALAAAIMAVILAVAITVNLALGRVIHWDIVMVFGLGGLAVLTLIRIR